MRGAGRALSVHMGLLSFDLLWAFLTLTHIMLNLLNRSSTQGGAELLLVEWVVLLLSELDRDAGPLPMSGGTDDG